MTSFDDGVPLTEHEREELARLAAGVDDPWLAYQLAGTEMPPLQPVPDGVWVPRWVAPLLLVMGALLAFVTFARWLWAGGVGLALIALGGWMLWQDQAPRWRPAALHPTKDRRPAAP